MSNQMLSLWKGRVACPDYYQRTMPEILADVCALHGLHTGDLLSRCRRQRVALARQQAMAEMYATGRLSLTQIGRFMNRDHATVLHGVRAHAARVRGAEVSEAA